MLLGFRLRGVRLETMLSYSVKAIRTRFMCVVFLRIRRDKAAATVIKRAKRIHKCLVNEPVPPYGLKHEACLS